MGGNSAFTSLSYTKTGLVTGTDYKFKARASNLFGWGEFSDLVTIRADEVPAQIAPIMTTTETVNVKF